MPKAPQWLFPLLNGGEESGLNEAGIQSFKRVDSLARETVQNILDHPDDSGLPRIAEFELIDLPVNEFPGLTDFVALFRACRDFVLPQLKGKKVGNEEKFFTEGLGVLDGPHIPVLRIGDFNTTGLKGGDLDRNKPFFRLLRGQGFSTAEGKGGGTYGIGQRAPFAYSALRTVLYSTRLPDGSQAFVAKAILASHPAPDDPANLRQAKGWWCVAVEGKEVWQALRIPAQIPARFHRTDVGTDLYVMGFVQHSQWEQDVRHSVLRNFFAAIHYGDLVIRIIKNGVKLREIDRNNLEAELLKAAEEARKSDRADDWRTGLLASVYYYKALKDPQGGEAFEKEILHLGNCKLFVFRDPKDKNTPQTWGAMRAPKMLITQYGSQMLDHYAAVFLCDSEEGNDYLARLEDLAHTKWHQDELRNCTESERAQAKKVISEIRAFVKDRLHEIAGVNADKPLDVPLLGQYLPGEPADNDPATGSGGAEPGEASAGEPLIDKANPVEVHLLAPADSSSPPPRAQVQERLPVGGLGGGGPGTKTGTSGGDGPGKKGLGPDEGGKGHSGPDSEWVLSPTDVRFRSYVDGGEYVVVVHPLKTVKGTLRIVAVGESGIQVPVTIIAATDTSGNPVAASGSSIPNLDLKEGATRRLRVSLNQELGTQLCLGIGRN